MICVRARPLFSSPFSLAISSTKQPPIHLRRIPLSSSSPRRLFSAVAMSSSSPPQNQIVEHIVLFKVKEDTDSSKISSMMNGLNNLVSLPRVLHISAAPLHRVRSSVSAFTHVLHSRYGSKEDLADYAAHPDHVRVVKEFVLPICDDVMAVDWIAHQVPGTLAPPPGSVAKITFLKVKENLSDEAKSEILDLIKGLDEKFPGIGQITVGENFSPARAKGFSIASIAYFKDLAELESVDSQTELVNSQKEKEKQESYVLSGT
ncbi:stress-response A/B barrel domain-containing protein UP3 isoform X2 [Eutrema salsugineum]|uniref:stress-response A/B barrel domain-containing protein UP3 isoform X2 n=1 Tax=Eutrema salsugineum TaxID=72664 RepID=UPI000CED160B|nr:stress-response A/B barrel domain-containing protein UP3 isoform X2 [Eutrema salsugineum]